MMEFDRTLARARLLLRARPRSATLATDEMLEDPFAVLRGSVSISPPLIA